MLDNAYDRDRSTVNRTETTGSSAGHKLVSALRHTEEKRAMKKVHLSYYMFAMFIFVISAVRSLACI